MVFQRIEQLKKEEAAERLRKNSLWEEERRREQLIKEARESQEARKGAENRAARRRKVDYLIQTSNIMFYLGQMEQKLKGTVPKVAIVTASNHENIIFAWGDHFSVKDDKIDYEEKKFLWVSEGVRDYSAIYIKVNPDSDSININHPWGILATNDNGFITKGDFNNPERIINALAEAYLMPYRYRSVRSEDKKEVYPETIPPEFSSRR